MKILVACEESQRVAISFRDKGHQAFSCDVKECSGGHPEYHIKGNALEVVNGNNIFYTQDGIKHDIVKYTRWDMVIAHPPCTYLSSAGARWMINKDGEINKDRLKKANYALMFFLQFYNANCDKICVENPLPMSNVIKGIPKYTQIISPSDFGSIYSKRTCLWLKGLPKLTPNKKQYCTISCIDSEWFNKGSGAERAANRSKTFWEVARAMAEQWG